MLISRKAFEKALEDERRKVDNEWIKRNEKRQSEEYFERRFTRLEERVGILERSAGKTIDEVDQCWMTKG
jgi:hypothetical protein